MEDPTATFMGFPLKTVSLITLVVQNSLLVLVMRYSRTLPGPRYLSSTAVVLSEFLKFLICIIVYYQSEKRQGTFSIRKLLQETSGPQSDWAKMLVPAVLYLIQNNLQYAAVSLLDAATFQVTYQLKILTTAIFSVILLQRKLSLLKWQSLVILTVGVALIQIPTDSKSSDESHDGLSRFAGLICVLFACILSGLAGVWFEKVLKGSKASLWVRNIQLCFFSIIPGLFFGVYVLDGEAVAEGGFFQGYNVWAWAAILCQAFGGLVVAVVVKYADNILKGFATSISIILSCIASIFLFGFQITFFFVIGTGFVLLATHLYGLPDKPQQEYVRV